jgi:hypothetical protein
MKSCQKLACDGWPYLGPPAATQAATGVTAGDLGVIVADPTAEGRARAIERILVVTETRRGDRAVARARAGLPETMASSNVPRAAPSPRRRTT